MRIRTYASGFTAIILKPGEEYEDFVAFLAAAVTETDAPVVQQMFKRLVKE